MSVDNDNMPSESLELFVYGVRAHYLADFSVYLKSVVIHYRYQIVKLIMSGQHCRLPYKAFFKLAIAENGVNSVNIVIQLSRKSHTAGGGNSLSQRTGAHINAGYLTQNRVAL